MKYVDPRTGRITYHDAETVVYFITNETDHDTDTHDWQNCKLCMKQAFDDGILESPVPLVLQRKTS